MQWYVLHLRIDPIGGFGSYDVLCPRDRDLCICYVLVLVLEESNLGRASQPSTVRSAELYPREFGRKRY